MPFVNAQGQVEQQRSWFRVSIVAELFWFVVNFFGLFLGTIFGDARTKIKNPASRQDQPFNPRGGGGGGGGGGGKPFIRGFKDLNRGGGNVPGGCCGGG
ncbi:hypothetical protein BASA81_000005 [Batrachochytrium salamandrivorans]|nr:hypothetical protein BASA81_000005 [Batrachochytrium salamandrivorans]